MLGMTGMGRSSCSNCPVKAPSHHCVRSSATNADCWSFTKRIDPAGTLQAMAATQPGSTESALGLHGFVAVPYCFDSNLSCLGDHFLDRRISALGSQVVCV